MVEKICKWGMAWTALVGVIVVCAFAVATTVPHTERESSDWTRAPIPATGAATTIDCSNAASASSGALTVNARYAIMCTDDSYLRWGATAPTAAAGDIVIPNGYWFDFATPNSAFYVACKNVNIDAACYYLELR